MRLQFPPRRAQAMSLAESARAFFRDAGGVQPPELPELLARGAQALQKKHPSFSLDDAALMARAAWAEAEAERTKCYVDLEASTPHMIVLVDQVAGVTRRIPVADLVRLLGPRAAG